MQLEEVMVKQEYDEAESSEEEPDSVDIKSGMHSGEAEQIESSTPAAVEPKETTTQPESEPSISREEAHDIILTHVQYICTDCHKDCLTFKGLVTHRVAEHGTSASMPCCGRTYFRRTHLLRHVLSVLNPNPKSAEKFRCPRCPRQFEYETQLEGHLKGHENKDNGLYKCVDCDKSFPSIKKLTYHRRTAHSVGDLRCDICGIAFNSSKYLLRHREEHSESKQCPICQKSYENKNTLRSHMLIHSSPRECEICGKMHPNFAALQRHKSRMHSETATKFTCDICGKKCRGPVERHRDGPYCKKVRNQSQSKAGSK